jgi:hypothetical protein
MVRLHSWEQPHHEAAPGAAAGSASVAGSGAGPDLAEHGPGEAAKREQAGAELVELLLHLHVDGQLSAKATCCLSYWAAMAGAVGAVRTLAHNPSAPTGHFQRHLDRVAGLRGCPEEFIAPNVPGHTKHSRERAVQTVRVVPPHECLHNEIVRDPAILQQIRPDEWPPSFHDHPVIRNAPPASVIPIAFYMDAAQYTKGGAAVVVFVVCNLISGARHLAAVLKKKDFCRCGCRGWCSLRPVFAFLDWSFQALAMGSFPAAQCDGAAWPASDPTRLSMVGLPLALRAAVVHVKGDWAEYAHSLGFPTWRHLEYPCLWCRCDRDSLYLFDDMDASGLPWDATVAADYESACVRCERHVVITTQGQRERVLEALFYDKRTLGSRGRSLDKDLPEFNLSAGDRLEPSPGCPDVGDLEHVALPATLVFWRPSMETLTKHRNPLFNTVTGISIESLTVDVLHCFYLGVLQAHCSQVVWSLVEVDAWDTRQAGQTTAPARMQESCTRLQADMAQWCRRRMRTHPHEKITLVQDITPWILGTSKEDQKFGLKGGETKTAFLYLHEFLQSCPKTMANKTHMMSASAALVRHMDLLKNAPRRFSPQQEQDSGMQERNRTLQ